MEGNRCRKRFLYQGSGKKVDEIELLVFSF